MPAFIRFHTQDANGQPIGGASLSATAPAHGPWAVQTNPCGDFYATLGPDVYTVTISAPGYVTRVIPMTLGDSGDILIGLESGSGPIPPGPIPPAPLYTPAPTREQVCRVYEGFQGEMVTTNAYGTFPVFGPETTTLSDIDLRQHVAQLSGRGWTHGDIAISWQYDEPGFHMPVPGRDLSQNLPELARRIAIMLERYKAVTLHLAGDGLSAPQNPDGSYPYNDPIGHTYGHEWLMENFPRIATYLKNSPYGDLTRYILFKPGYDGVFYGWGKNETPDLQPDRVVAFGRLFRQVLPDGYLGIEHTPGKIPVGEGGSDWVVGGRMMDYDVVLGEFFWPFTGDQVWQVLGRCIHPYHRPPDQPAGDDPHPPFYLAYDTPRGPIYYIIYEYATYQWTRGQVTVDQIAAVRAYARSMGAENVC